MLRMALVSAALGLALTATQKPSSRPTSPRATPGQNHTLAGPDLKNLEALEPIDVHTHVAKSDPAFFAFLQRLHMHIMDILVVDDHNSYRRALEPQLRDALRVVRESDHHAVLCTTFDPFAFNRPDFQAAAIRELDRNFAEGAVAVKIWKNVGMELKDKSGRYVLPDNPAFEPIFRHIAERHRTLVAHIAEPDEAWQPPNPKGLDYSYYQENPVWYMYRKPDAPKKKAVLEARDKVLAANPNLRVVGAHLGTMEDDLGLLAEHLDRYPNFAVDTAARVIHLVVQPRDKVRAFLIKYQDRILYGTDLGLKPDETSRAAIREWAEQYAMDWRYFATNDVFQYSGHKVQGLGLPEPVLRKLYHDNAVHWIPGIIVK